MPDAKCLRWDEFISEITDGDIALARFLQKALGYALSGDTCEECFFILYGPTTRNGKGTLMETILNIFGDYGRTIQPESLAQKRINGSGPSPDIARLDGIRLVNASELSADLKT